MTIVPAQAIEVRVVRADDGKPMAGGVGQHPGRAVGPDSTRQIVGATGRRSGPRADRPLAGRLLSRLRLSPARASPTSPERAYLDWPKGAVQQSVEVKLKRGVVVHGKLTEEPSGAPVAGAGISYYQRHRNNPTYLDSLDQIDAVSRPDGTFTMVVPAGPGDVLVRGPSADYLHVSTSWDELGTGIHPSFPMYPDAVAHLDHPPDETAHDLAVKLRRGMTVQGRVIGPDGKPIAEAFAFGRSYAPYEEHKFPFVPFNGPGPRIAVRDGRFEIPGCDPEKPSTFYFLDVNHQLGATVEISGKSAATGPVTVPLQRCGSARVRFKDPDGKPIVDHGRESLAGQPVLDHHTGPRPCGGRQEYRPDFRRRRIPGQPGSRSEQQPPHRPRRLHHVRQPDPRRAYRFRDHEFTAEPGETIDLPDITVGGRK